MNIRSSVTSVLIASLTGFFLVVLFAGVVLVTRGLHVDHFALSNIDVHGLSLSWQKGLNLEVTRIQLGEQQEKNTKEISGIAIRRGVNTVHFLQKLIPSFIVHSFQYQGYSGELYYNQKNVPSPLVFNLNSEVLHLKATLSREQEKLRLILEAVSSKIFQFSGSGSFLIDYNTVQIQGEIQGTLADGFPVHFTIQADVNGISFQGRGRDEVTSIKPFVDPFGLSPDIQQWITSYLKGSSYHLDALTGSCSWDDPAELLDTLTASVRVDDCEYTFAQGLEPIKTTFTEVFFSKGVLKIIPHDSSFYGQKGQASWLEIDFNDPDNILLFAYIRTRARLNTDIINLLEYYSISLPFLQTTGMIDTDLTLIINLNHDQVEAQGTFDVDRSMFRYQGTSVQVQDGRVELKNGDVRIEALELGVKDFFTARVDGVMNVEKNRTELKFKVDTFHLPLKYTPLNLDSSHGPLLFSYHTLAEQGTLVTEASHWQFGTENVTLDAFTAPFNFQQLSGTLPPTRLVVSSVSDLVIDGDFNLKKQLVDMELTLHQVKMQSLDLAQDFFHLSVQYDHGLHVTGRKKSRWRFAGRELLIAPFDFHYGNDQLTVERVQVQSAGLFDSFISGTFNLMTEQGKLSLDNLSFAQKNQSPWLTFPQRMSLDLKVEKGGTRVHLDELGVSFSSDPSGGWDVAVSDLSKLLDHSTLLRRFEVGGGSLHLATVSPESSLQFSGEVTSSYDFLVQNDLPQSSYVFSGQYDETGLEMVINRDLRLHYGKTLEIQSQNIGYNVGAILRFQKAGSGQKADDDSEPELPDITLKAENGFLFFRKENRILADTLTFTTKGNEHALQITHDQGTITLNSKGDDFVLHGQQLGEQFINALVMGADFVGGALTVFAEGTRDTFTAVFSTKNILLKNYAVLNNMLAVINTVPALMTFSLPYYDSEGWPVDSMHLWFDYNKGIATVKTMEFDSAEMDLRGSGSIDLLKKQLDLHVNLITQAGQNMSKLPLVGYILAGEEQRPTLTFHVTGDILDPKVENTAFEEVVTMPFEMIYRTLKTPFRWAGELMDFEAPDKQEDAEQMR